MLGQILNNHHIPMDQVFSVESAKYISLLKEYLDDSVDLEDVVKQAERVDLVKEIGNERFLSSLKHKVFSFVKGEYEKLMVLDTKIRRSSDTEVVEMDRDVFLRQAERFSSATEPPFGYERSCFFKGPYPTQGSAHLGHKSSEE